MSRLCSGRASVQYGKHLENGEKMNTKNLRLAREALIHTSYGEMRERFDALEQAARDNDIEDPQDMAEAQFFMDNGFTLDDVFSVYVALCLEEGRDPVMPDGTPISVTTVGRQRMAGLLDALTA